MKKYILAIFLMAFAITPIVASAQCEDEYVAYLAAHAEQAATRTDYFIGNATYEEYLCDYWLHIVALYDWYRCIGVRVLPDNYNYAVEQSLRYC